MARLAFEQKQRYLQDKVLVLGSRVEEILQGAVDALKQRDLEKSTRLIVDSRNLNQVCNEIETDTLVALATQQPMAGDLRFLAGVLEIALELGRVGKHTREISEINLKLGPEKRPKALLYINYMAESARKMLRLAMEAFARRDVILARSISVQDDEVDDLFSETYRHLLATVKTNPELAAQSIYLSQVAHQLERVADRATNICEWIVYVITGEMVETNMKPDDYASAFERKVKKGEPHFIEPSPNGNIDNI